MFVLEDLAQRWWIFALQGAVAIIFGVLAIAQPGITLEVLILLFALWALVGGVLSLIGSVGAAEAREPWWPLVFEGLLGIGFGGLKQKLLGSIAAIAAVNVLEWFMDIDRSVDNTKLAWVVGILLAFAVAMLILAIADRISEQSEEKSSE